MRPDFQTIDEITRRLAESVPGELKTAGAELDRLEKLLEEKAQDKPAIDQT